MNPEIEPRMDVDETRIGEKVEGHGPSVLINGEITKAIIAAAFEVHRELGYGFLEKVYQRALQAELIGTPHEAEVEKRTAVLYKAAVVGEYFADLVVDGKVIVEIKVAPEYNPYDEAQLINELKATGFEDGLLLNFGRRKVQSKRMAYQSAFIRGLKS